MKIFRIAAAVIILGLAAALCWPSGYMVSRDIGCARALTPRGTQLCAALAGGMQWTWLGHAIVSPGWRVTWKTIHDVHCTQKPGPADIADLEALRKAGTDWRLQDGTDELIRLIRNQGGHGDEPASSIFNPRNPDYILKDGCR